MWLLPVQAQSGDNYGPRVSPDGKKVAFYSYRTGNPDVFVMNIDGSNQTNITRSAGTWDTEPYWSPDGSQLLFRSDRDDPGGNRELYKMDADGSNVHRLTYNKGFDTATDWVDDKIYFYNLVKVSDARMVGNIYVMDEDGSNKVLLKSVEQDGGRPNVSPDGQKILYERKDLESGETYMYTMDMDGTNETRILDQPGLDPVWSPDGSKVVFGATWDGYDGIYVMDADGTNIKPVSDAQDAPAYFHDWDPDGEHVVYDASRHGISDIMRVNITTMEKENLTKQGDYKWSPTWAKGKLAFESKQDANAEIYLVPAEGQDPINLTNNPASDQQPSMSPDGKKVVFMSDRDGNPELYVLDIKKDRLTRLTENEAADLEPSWSPDGKYIAFVSSREGGRDVFVMKADGSEVRKVNQTQGVYARPSWSGNGKSLVYFSNKEGNWEVYHVKADGSDEKNLTNDEGSDFYGALSPDGKQAVFVSTRVGNRERHLYVVNTDGTGLKQLTNSGTPARSNHYPIWTAENRIVFISNRTGTYQVYAVDPSGDNLQQLTQRQMNYTY